MSKTRRHASKNQRPNVIGATARPIYDKASFVEAIKENIPQSELLTNLRKSFAEGESMLREGEFNDKLYIILEGYVAQVKEGEDVQSRIGMHGPGDFIGLLSFQTGEPVFTTANATTKVVTLSLDHQSFEVFMNKYPEISRTLQGLIFSNLADRYRKVVMLHVEVASLTKQLQEERNQLKHTIRELERTRNALISQEKMATLGELTSGLAHEINNPASALLRSVEYLSVNLPVMAERASALPDTGLVRFFFEAGMERTFADTAAQRNRMKELARELPGTSRSILRILAEMNAAVFEKIKPFLRSSKNDQLLQLLIDAYQSGVFLNGIRLSTARIEYLVKSLKSYSRQGGKDPEVVDISEGIKETLQIIGNRLKDVKVVTHMEDSCPVECFVGELNQVWTNIIINACDAMKDKGNLLITCSADQENGWVVVSIADDGPGVPDKIKKKIFDSSFTTKTAGGDFGLGIGLAISRSIIEKHLGTIEVVDRKGGGAEFIVKLPLYQK